MDQLLAEIQKAQDLMGHVQALRHSAPCPELTSLMKEVGGVSEASGTFSWRHSATLTPFSFVTCHSEGRAVEPLLLKVKQGKALPSAVPHLSELGGLNRPPVVPEGPGRLST